MADIASEYASRLKGFGALRLFGDAFTPRDDDPLVNHPAVIRIAKESGHDQGRVLSQLYSDFGNRVNDGASLFQKNASIKLYDKYWSGAKSLSEALDMMVPRSNVGAPATASAAPAPVVSPGTAPATAPMIQQPVSMPDTLRDPTLSTRPAAPSSVPSTGIPVVGEQRMVNNLPVSEVFNDTKTLGSLSPSDYTRQVEVMNRLMESKLPAGAMRRVDANGNVVVSQGSGQKMNPDGTYTVRPGDGGGVVQNIGRSDRVVGSADDPVLYYLNGYPITKSEHERRQSSLDGNMIVGSTNPADKLPPLRDTQMRPKLNANDEYVKRLEEMKIQADVSKSKDASTSAQRDRESREKIAGIEAAGSVAGKEAAELERQREIDLRDTERVVKKAVDAFSKDVSSVINKATSAYSAAKGLKETDASVVAWQNDQKAFFGSPAFGRYAEALNAAMLQNPQMKNEFLAGMNNLTPMERLAKLRVAAETWLKENPSETGFGF